MICWRALSDILGSCGAVTEGWRKGRNVPVFPKKSYLCLRFMLFRTISQLLPLLLGLFLLTGFVGSERPAVYAANSPSAVFDRPEDSAATDRNNRLLPEYAGTDASAALLSLRPRIVPNLRSATVFTATGMCGITDKLLSENGPAASVCKPARFRDSYRYYIYALERMRI